MSLPKNTERHKTNLRDQANCSSLSGFRFGLGEVDETRGDDHANDITRAALLTGVGRSAIASIAIQGPNAQQAIDSCFAAATNTPFRVGQIRYGQWRMQSVAHPKTPQIAGHSVDTGESVVLLPIAISEATSAFEVHCHGGSAATARIIHDLTALDVQICRAEEFGWRTNVPLITRENTSVLTRCSTKRTAGLVLDQLRGGLKQWCQQVLLLEDDSDAVRVRSEASEMLRSADFFLRLGDRFRVVLAGPPNVGKSSLINAIVGYDRSITMDFAGTTRDVLHADTVIDGLPIRLSDTAGIHQARDQIEHEGVKKAIEATSDAELIIWVVDPDTSSEPYEHFSSTAPQIRVLNKCDLLVSSERGRTDTSDANQQFEARLLMTSATANRGIDELMSEISKRLVPELATKVDFAACLTVRQRDCVSLISVAESLAAIKELSASLLFGPLPKAGR